MEPRNQFAKARDLLRRAPAYVAQPPAPAPQPTPAKPRQAKAATKAAGSGVVLADRNGR